MLRKRGNAFLGMKGRKIGTLERLIKILASAL
jgi:hypothetical protein